MTASTRRASSRGSRRSPRELAGRRGRGLGGGAGLRAVGCGALHQLHAPHDDRPRSGDRRYAAEGSAGRLRSGRALRRDGRRPGPIWSCRGSTGATTRPRTRSIPAPWAGRSRRRCRAIPRGGPVAVFRPGEPSMPRTTASTPPRLPRGTEVVRRILAGMTRQGGPDDHYGMFYNVNFPPVPAAAGASGIRADHRTGLPRRGHVLQRRAACLAPSGRQVPVGASGGDAADRRRKPGTDAAVCLWTAMSRSRPMRADLTAHDALERFRGDRMSVTSDAETEDAALSITLRARKGVTDVAGA